MNIFVSHSSSDQKKVEKSVKRMSYLDVTNYFDDLYF